MFKELPSKLLATIIAIVQKRYTFVISYEKKDFYAVSEMVFAATVYNFYKRQNVIYP